MSDIGSNIYTRGRLYLDSYTRSRINYGYDRDWFRIYLRGGQRVRFDLEGSPTGRGTLRDTYLRGIYDSRGRYISGTRNDDGGVGANSRVTFTASRSGYYYVAASGYGSRTGSYRLTARALSGGGGYGYRRPDLVVTSGYASGNFRAGGRVYANVTVRNQGSASTGRSSYVGYYLSTNSTITTSDTRLDYDYVSSLRSGRSGYEYEYFNLPTNLVAGREPITSAPSPIIAAGFRSPTSTTTPGCCEALRYRCRAGPICFSKISIQAARLWRDKTLPFSPGSRTSVMPNGISPAGYPTTISGSNST